MSQNTQTQIELEQPEQSQKPRELVLFLKSVAASGLGAVASLLSYMLFLPLLDWLGATFLPDFFLLNLIAHTVDDASHYSPAVLVYAFVLSTCIGQAIGFVLNRKVAFKANNNVVRATLFTLLLVVFSIVASGFIGPWMVWLVSRIPSMPHALVQVFGKVLTMTVAIVWIYPANRFLIHRVVKKGSADDPKP